MAVERETDTAYDFAMRTRERFACTLGHVMNVGPDVVGDVNPVRREGVGMQNDV